MRTKTIVLREFEEQKKAGPLRDLVRKGHALEDSPPRPLMTFQESRNRQIEVMNRRRKEKEADKAAQNEAKKQKLAQNLAKTSSGYKALIAKLNEVAELEIKNPAKKDKDGHKFDHFFNDRHREEDLDYLAKDLSKMDLNDIKRAMRFDEDELRIANQLEMLYTRAQVEQLADKKKL